jgi:glycosyltransferase involved in cell wall biosynthesis
MPTFDYIFAMAAQLEKQFREHRPEIVIAASNFANSLPALIAARKAGVPFVYEVRGLWEITRQSKEEEFEDTSAFHVQKILEAEVARQADHVFTLTQALKEELVLRGAAADKVTLAPNSCDPDRFVPAKRDRALADKLGIPDDVPVIGYVGTFVAYEGLEDLAAACGLLKASGLKFRLLLIGNENASGLGRGRISNDIERIAKDGGFADWLIMTGRVPHDDVVKYYTLVDICPFPRKPWPVCEMVSPLKPLEALAMEKAVVVSSVRALAEMIEDGVRGLIFEKGSVAAMASALGRLVENADERARFGKSGRAWVIEQRTWRAVAGLVSRELAQIARGPDKCAP